MLTDVQIQELEAKHGRIGVVRSRDGKSWEIVLRKPSRMEYRQFRSNVNNPQRHDMAQETLVKQTCVSPDGAGLEALLDEWPGIPEACSRILIELAGMAGDEQGKS